MRMLYCMFGFEQPVTTTRVVVTSQHGITVT